jgi:hypothetical protein
VAHGGGTRQWSRAGTQIGSKTHPETPEDKATWVRASSA